ncbi:hypothetical protein JOQ06_025454 [Pogonophryne albipinna]|uniref:JAB1/MPN/MOV34 metalloenzyme domain-containing protein n=1 Tax=Pogonophryne albipinna TaxID=1090488 RepID=A0AAD6AUT4_9TELE|nr:hypothetical protein JOQ06_025454 [Pogonophryne albipinna]
MASRKESATASTAVMAIPAGTLDSPVNQIQIEGLVVLKIIKHYQEEGQGSEVVQGVLLGLVVEDRLEITNCFPFPQHTEDDADFDEDSRTAQNFLLAIPLPHAKLLALPSAGGRGCQTPFWARTMLHIGSDEGNSCHTGETNKFKGVCFAMCPDLSN